MAGVSQRQVVRLAAALVPLLLLVSAPMPGVAGQTSKSTTEKRTFSFQMTVTTNEVQGCLTVWDLTLTNSITNTDTTTAWTRGPTIVSGSVTRTGACSQTLQITLSSGYPVSSSTLTAFNVWSNASHINLKGSALDVLPQSLIAPGANVTFNMDVDCAATPNIFPKSITTYSANGVKTTVTSTGANCGIGPLSSPAFNPSGLVNIWYPNNGPALDWTKLVGVTQVGISYASEKTVTTTSNRRMLRA
ncbi:hypothetical protein HYH02_001854 [Chlamydomonas schloesseri]|uniref:Uncharacterized protein n=1 Tax=Chlamydomonas schloesseri TaxID=2026947 RepID=A0A835WU15_9CHLO|nr:hypothetical protein HYH02_001854 [Chlamydomonas schloesseri]|eukprot:KAG2453641.1 hypothetical protein HYH02_001854 [Chlamydomonas schloesseri]